MPSAGYGTRRVPATFLTIVQSPQVEAQEFEFGLAKSAHVANMDV